ncbi:hypothetical protein Hanom_Chr02g00100571 [Helianthus anomalus]
MIETYLIECNNRETTHYGFSSSPLTSLTDSSSSANLKMGSEKKIKPPVS